MLLEINLGVRLLLLAVLCPLLTLYMVRRGLQTGFILLLATAMVPMTHAWVIRSDGALPHLTFERLVWPLIVLAFFWQWKQGRIRNMRPDWIEYAMVALCVVILLSMYRHGTYISDQWGAEKLRMRPFMNGFVYPFTAYFIARRTISTARQLRALLLGAGALTLYVIIVGVGEATGQHWLVVPKFILDPTEGIHFGYVRGPFLAAARNGLAMSMGLPIFLALSLVDRSPKRWLWAAIIILAGIPVSHTFERSAWLGCIAGLGVTAMAWPGRRVLFTGLFVLWACAAVVFLPDALEKRLAEKLAKKETVEFRLQLIEHSVAALRSEPLTGVGFYAFTEEVAADAMGRVSSHNTPLTLFVELGVLGFAPYALIFALLLLDSFRAYRLHPPARRMIALQWGITAAYLLTSMAIDLREAMYHNVLLFAVSGAVLEAARNYRLTGAKTEAPVVHFV